MAFWSEESRKERPTAPKSPSECDFSDVFFERNSDPKLKVPASEICGKEAEEQYDGSSKEFRGTQENSTTDANSRTTESREKDEQTKIDTEEADDADDKGELVGEEDNLIDAIKQDRPDAVQKLLNDGCDPNEPADVEGNRPLHWAVFSKKAEHVQMLLDAGVDVNLPGKQNATPIMVTPSLYRHDAPWDIVHSIIKANCDINWVANSSKSTLHLAVQLGNADLVKILLEYNVDIDIRDSKGRSPIMYAGLLSGANILQYTTEYTFKDVEQIAFLLIKANANVFHVDKFRQNALHLTIPNIELCDRSRVQQISPCIIQMLELAGTKIPPKRFLRRWSSVSREASKNVQKVIQWFEKQRTVVKPLHHSCRLVIRKAIGQRLPEKLSQVTLPDKIKDYLLLPELDDLMDQLGSL